MHAASVHITAVLVEYQTKAGRTNRGVTTSWLKRLTANGQCDALILLILLVVSLAALAVSLSVGNSYVHVCKLVTRAADSSFKYQNIPLF